MHERSVGCADREGRRRGIVVTTLEGGRKIVIRGGRINSSVGRIGEGTQGRRHVVCYSKVMFSLVILCSVCVPPIPSFGTSVIRLVFIVLVVRSAPSHPSVLQSCGSTAFIIKGCRGIVVWLLVAGGTAVGTVAMSVDAA